MCVCVCVYLCVCVCVYTHIIDSLCCTAETNTTLQINYAPMKVNYKKKKKTSGGLGWGVFLSPWKCKSTSCMIYHVKRLDGWRANFPTETSNIWSGRWCLGLQGHSSPLTWSRGLMVKLPAVGFIQETYWTFMTSFRDSLFRSYLGQSEAAGERGLRQGSVLWSWAGTCPITHVFERLKKD